MTFVEAADPLSNEVAQFLAETLEDATFGLVDSVEGEAQGSGDVRWGQPLDRDTPEGLPGPILELVAYQLRGTLEQAALLLWINDLLRIREWVWNLGELLESRAAAHGLGLSLLPTEEVADLVAGDRQEPTPESILSTVLAKVPDVTCHSSKDFLEHVSPVLGLELMLPTPVVHQRAVQIDQALPGFPILGRLDAFQEA
jgi:hypothetical protein